MATHVRASHDRAAQAAARPIVWTAHMSTITNGGTASTTRACSLNPPIELAAPLASGSASVTP
jgi:hypothetical protein